MGTADSAIVLVRPQIHENVGFVARSMKAFGFADLRIVGDPADWSLSSPAYRTASGAEDRLLNMAVFETLREAVADCHRVFAFSRRPHQFHRPGLSIQQWSGGAWRSEPDSRAALVFGPEDQGLSNEDKKLSDAIVEIPMQAETLSLNLAHAAAVVMYELTRETLAPAPQSPKKPVAREDLDRIVNEAVSVLDRSEYFKEGRREIQMEVLRSLLLRLELRADEYPAVIGALKSVTRVFDDYGVDDPVSDDDEE